MSDLISRQAALEKVRAMQTYKLFVGDDMILVDKAEVQTELMMLPTAQPEPKWIPCSERLPKENEYVDNVCKYYLIQDEYGDMHVAHLSGRGWETIESIKALGCEVLAWMPLPEPYREESEVEE